MFLCSPFAKEKLHIWHICGINFFLTSCCHSGLNVALNRKEEKPLSYPDAFSSMRLQTSDRTCVLNSCWCFPIPERRYRHNVWECLPQHILQIIPKQWMMICKPAKKRRVNACSLHYNWFAAVVGDVACTNILELLHIPWPYLGGNGLWQGSWGREWQKFRPGCSTVTCNSHMEYIVTSKFTSLQMCS